MDQLKTEPKLQEKIRIIGAGFSGLTSAYYLLKAGFEVEIYEKTERVGGLLQSFKSPYGLVENAANALINSKRLEELAKDIGLNLSSSLKESRARLLFRNGPRRFPVRLSELFILAKFVFKLLFFRDSLAPKSSESIRSWGARVLSPKLSLYTIETALQGIYAGDPDKMSASLILKKLFTPKLDAKVKKGSVAPLNGMSELVEKLQIYLQANGVKFFCNQSLVIKELKSPLILAVPAYEAAKILQVFDPQLALLLSKIEYVPVISANVFFDENGESLKAFGCLFPPEKSNLVLGVLFNQCIFAGRVKNSISEKWILGGGSVKNRKDFLALSDHEILVMLLEKRRLIIPSLQKKSIADLLKMVINVHIIRWERAFPNYSTELESVLHDLKAKDKNIVLHGNYLGELGLTKILDRSARIAEQMILASGME